MGAGAPQPLSSKCSNQRWAHYVKTAAVVLTSFLIPRGKLHVNEEKTGEELNKRRWKTNKTVALIFHAFTTEIRSQ